MESNVLKACGLDVHQASVTACIIRQGLQRQVKTFGTTTIELLSLKLWLQQHEITHIAMESTGVFGSLCSMYSVRIFPLYLPMPDTSKMFREEKQMLRIVSGFVNYLEPDYYNLVLFPLSVFENYEI